jgi:phage portal protein BeeE
MGLVDYFLGSQINKRANEVLAKRAAEQLTRNISLVNLGINEALPAINADAGDYQNIFKTIGAVYEVTDAITKKVLNCPLVFYKVKDKSKLQRSKTIQKHDPVQAFILKAQAIEEVDNSELLALLTTGKANPYQNGTQAMWTAILSFLLQGNTYLHGVKVGEKAKELYCFPNMTVDANPDDLLDPLRGYTLQDTNLTKFTLDEIYHIKTGNPAPIDRTMQYLYGVSPIRAYLEPVRSIAEGKKQGSKQLKNGGNFGILSPRDKEDQFGTEQKQALKEKMLRARKSDDELSRVFPSSIPLAWQSIGLSVGDLKLLEIVSASEEDIYRAYHWPLQFHNQKASTSNNQATAVKQAIYDAVAPVCDIMGESLTAFLGAGYGGITIELDYTQLPEMAVNMKDVAAYLSALPKGVLTYNEMRAVLRYGEKSEAYMNEHFVESGLVPLRSVYEQKSPVSGAE